MDEMTIRNLYTIKGWTIKQIAEQAGISEEAIRKRMKKYGVPRRAHGTPKGQPKSLEHTAKLREHMAALHKGMYGEDHPGWKGGRYIDSYGYVIIRVNGKSVKEHRYVMEQHLGRPLASNEVIHHRDANKENNDLDNLRLKTVQEHVREHWAHPEWRQRVEKGWTPEKRQAVSDRFSKPIPGLNEDALRNLYIDRGWNLRQIAEFFGSNRETIRQLLKKHSIRRD